MIPDQRIVWAAPAVLALQLSATAPANAHGLRVGAARIDITPAADPANNRVNGLLGLIQASGK